MKKKGYTMTLDRIDVSPNTNDDENWHCPDCQSWGPFRVDVTRRVRLSDEGPHVRDDDGPTDYDHQAFARCPDCQRQAPVASFRHEGA
jgi:rubredoxin